MRLGVIRNSPVFHRQQFALLLSKRISSYMVEVLNGKIYDLIESGLVPHMLSTFANHQFNLDVINKEDKNYYICLNENSISSLNDAYRSIRLENLLKFVFAILVFDCCLVSVFVFRALYRFVKRVLTFLQEFGGSSRTSISALR